MPYRKNGISEFRWGFLRKIVSNLNSPMLVLACKHPCVMSRAFRLERISGAIQRNRRHRYRRTSGQFLFKRYERGITRC